VPLLLNQLRSQPLPKLLQRKPPLLNRPPNLLLKLLLQNPLPRLPLNQQQPSLRQKRQPKLLQNRLQNQP
jgi:hypothetical protein